MSASKKLNKQAQAPKATVAAAPVATAPKAKAPANA